MKALLIDVKGTMGDKTPKIIDVDENNALEEYYKYLGCECIDIVSHCINGKSYDVIVDDEGLFTERPIPSAFCRINGEVEPMLVGNLLFVNYGGNGELAALTENDISNIMHRIGFGITQDDEILPVVTFDPIETDRHEEAHSI